jgi:hypothetical protein
MQQILSILEKLQQKTQWHTISWTMKEFGAVYKLLAWGADRIFPGELSCRLY